MPCCRLLRSRRRRSGWSKGEGDSARNRFPAGRALSSGSRGVAETRNQREEDRVLLTDRDTRWRQSSGSGRHSKKSKHVKSRRGKGGARGSGYTTKVGPEPRPRPTSSSRAVNATRSPRSQGPNGNKGGEHPRHERATFRRKESAKVSTET